MAEMWIKRLENVEPTAWIYLMLWGAVLISAIMSESSPYTQSDPYGHLILLVISVKLFLDSMTAVLDGFTKDPEEG